MEDVPGTCYTLVNHRTIDSEISKVTQWVENVVWCLLGSEQVAKCEYRRGHPGVV